MSDDKLLPSAVELEFDAKMMDRLQKDSSYDVRNSIIDYEQGCCESSVPVIALKYSVHNKNSRVIYYIFILNMLVPGTGTVLAACVTTSKVINCKAVFIGLL